MCTVSVFYKDGTDFVLTSNRDEAPNRSALQPREYKINSTQVLMPKDELSGGSWIGVSSKKRVVCLLNGGFTKHKRILPYKKSRGVVVSDFLQMDSSEELQEYDFLNIEPFTIVFTDWNKGLKFIEVVWDGLVCQIKNLDLSTYIWSSSTLYTQNQKEDRLNWFDALKKEETLTASRLLDFHKTAGKGNLDYGVIMDRVSVKTTSITQVEKIGDNISMRFEDFNTGQISTKILQLT
ncbi:NRDE family protein [Aurantibacter sp.]|uniref:NRDE family protein n=1 Tax=Aurantibacter sp. TaxID=2807103 RepID=UPI0035C7AA80